ncbi:MAG: MerR family transcriptional regulator [Maricaulaceae bacterium]
MPSKTTRAFRTISEAGDELGLQPHVLRFWESKFPQIKPMKRGGGRRFYRPEDIEFLRGIKILLHDEKHPIKDVQKLIRKKGAASVVDLGRSIEQAAQPKTVEETVLIPPRIVEAETPSKTPAAAKANPAPDYEYVREDDVHAGGSLAGDDMPVYDMTPDDIILEEDAPAAKPTSPSAPKPEPAPKRAKGRSEPIFKHVATIDEVPAIDRDALEDALGRLTKLRGRWDKFKT